MRPEMRSWTMVKANTGQFTVVLGYPNTRVALLKYPGGRLVDKARACGIDEI